jgi:hypothetical protein
MLSIDHPFLICAAYFYIHSIVYYLARVAYPPRILHPEYPLVFNLKEDAEFNVRDHREIVIGVENRMPYKLGSWCYPDIRCQQYFPVSINTVLAAISA